MLLRLQKRTCLSSDEERKPGRSIRRTSKLPVRARKAVALWPGPHRRLGILMHPLEAQGPCEMDTDPYPSSVFPIEQRDGSHAKFATSNVLGFERNKSDMSECSEEDSLSSEDDCNKKLRRRRPRVIRKENSEEDSLSYEGECNKKLTRRRPRAIRREYPTQASMASAFWLGPCRHHTVTPSALDSHSASSQVERLGPCIKKDHPFDNKRINLAVPQSSGDESLSSDDEHNEEPRKRRRRRRAKRPQKVPNSSRKASERGSHDSKRMPRRRMAILRRPLEAQGPCETTEARPSEAAFIDSESVILLPRQRYGTYAGILDSKLFPDEEGSGAASGLSIQGEYHIRQVVV